MGDWRPIEERLAEIRERSKSIAALAAEQEREVSLLLRGKGVSRGDGTRRGEVLDVAIRGALTPDPQTAREVAQAIGVSYNPVRDRLKLWAREGKVGVEGRRTKRYFLR
jgi:hypothetical protein